MTVADRAWIATAGSLDVRFTTGRRGLLGVLLCALPPPQEQQGTRETKILCGTLPPGASDFVYLPLRIPAGVSELRVAYTYEKRPVPAGTQGNALDIGIFDERGTDLGGKISGPVSRRTARLHGGQRLRVRRPGSGPRPPPSPRASW